MPLQTSIRSNQLVAVWRSILAPPALESVDMARLFFLNQASGTVGRQASTVMVL